MLVIADRVKEASATAGAGPLALTGAFIGFRSFSAVCAIGDTCFYALQAVDASGAATGEWEVGLGTYSALNTLTRTTPLASSNAGAAVNLLPGAKQVWIDIAATQLGALASSAYVDAADAALSASIATKASTAYVDAADAALSASIATKPSTAYVDAADAALSASIATKADLASPTFTGTVVVAAFTVGNGSAATFTFNSNLSGATDPSIAFADNTVSLQPDGSARMSVTNTRTMLGNGIALAWSNTATTPGSADTHIWRAAANSIQFGGAINGIANATTRTEINKTVTAFSNGVAKATFTVTIPNAAHSAVIEFEFLGMLGAGGAISANEAVASNTYKVVVTRTPGANAVASAVSAAWGAVAANVAGATTATCTAAVSAIAGAAGANNTFTMDVTITRGGGASDNHACLCYAKSMNANSGGITIA